MGLGLKVLLLQPAVPVSPIFVWSVDLLGASWVVISGGISPPIRVIIVGTLLITPLITTREPPSGACSWGSTSPRVCSKFWPEVCCAK